VAKVFQIALTGGIASGKSLVADRLRELGAVVIDADRLAREVVEPGTPGLAQIRDRFGESVITADGSLDRKALGAIVFADEQARLDLNGITHPAIIERRRALMADLPEDAVVVQDIPLLVETVPDPHAHYDRVLVVHADEDERVRRMIENRGMSRDEAEGRMRAQAAEADRLAVADVVIDNTASIERTLEQVDDFWASIPR
jgi:dephospho-CoA kinase